MELTTGVPGRFLWSRATLDDVMYQFFVEQEGRLGSLLGLTDSAEDLFSRVFAHNPDLRITISEFRRAVLACGNISKPAVETKDGMTVYNQGRGRAGYGEFKLPPETKEEDDGPPGNMPDV